MTLEAKAQRPHAKGAGGECLDRGHVNDGPCYDCTALALAEAYERGRAAGLKEAIVVADASDEVADWCDACGRQVQKAIRKLARQKPEGTALPVDPEADARFAEFAKTLVKPPAKARRK